MYQKLCALFLALAMLATACGGSDSGDSESASGSSAAGSDETITLVVNPWSASRLNVEVAHVHWPL